MILENKLQEWIQYILAEESKVFLNPLISSLHTTGIKSLWENCPPFEIVLNQQNKIVIATESLPTSQGELCC